MKRAISSVSTRLLALALLGLGAVCLGCPDSPDSPGEPGASPAPTPTPAAPTSPPAPGAESLLALAGVTLELSGVEAVPGGFLVVEDELVGSVLFVDQASFAAGAPQARLAKLERKRKLLPPGAELEKLLPVQDFEGIARDAEWVYLVGSHAGALKGKKKKAHWEPREDREFLIRARWNPEERSLTVPRASKEHPERGVYRELRQALQSQGEETDGLNVEGLDHLEGRLYLGLRAPLHEGRATILHASPDDVFSAQGLTLKTLRCDLQGAGIRGLHHTPEGKLLALSGPIQDASEPAPALWEIDPASGAAKRLRLLEPQAGGFPEGLCFASPTQLLIVYDAEGASRAPLQLLPWPLR